MLDTLYKTDKCRYSQELLKYKIADYCWKSSMVTGVCRGGVRRDGVCHGGVRCDVIHPSSVQQELKKHFKNIKRIRDGMP